MLLSINWLRRHIDLDGLAAVEIRDALTMSTAEVEDVRDYGGGLSGLVVGEVVERQPHPDADKLSLCRVDVGGPELLSIVCGANNVAAGQKVCVIQPGQNLPDGSKIKKSKIRGQESFGMICSERELGLSDEHEGILVLPAAARAGQPFLEALPVADHVLEIDNKSVNHRPDLWGHHGFARELAAIFDRPLRPLAPPLALPNAGQSLPVKIEAGDACRRYLGLCLDEVQSLPSPSWLRYLLLAVGQRPRNQLVDLTNFVMLDLGQPMHAFDRRHLDQARGMTIRFARSHETITTLDEQSFVLSEQDLLIASGDRPVALAGIMGGAGCAVDSATVSLFLESANFHPSTIRRSSARLSLRTDSSARFEKSLDPALAQTAVHHFVSLLQQLQPQCKVSGPLVDPAPFSFTPPVIELRRDSLDRRLGHVVDGVTVQAILRRLQFGVESTAAGFAVTVPSFRASKDISIEADLIEEVGRMYRYDNIPEVPLATIAAVPPRDPELFLARRILNLGALELACSEVYNYSFLSDSMVSAVGGDDLTWCRVSNPVAPELARIRRHVLPSLLSCVAANLRQQEQVRLMEQGKGYHGEHRDDDGLPFEVHEIGFVFAARDSELDLCGELRSRLLRLLGRLGYRIEPSEMYRAPDRGFVHPHKTVALAKDEIVFGHVGHLHPQVCRNLALGLNTAIASLDLRQLLRSEVEPHRYKEVPRFPSQPVDVAFLAPEAVRVGAVAQMLRDASRKLVRDVRLFEVYRGPGLPDGHKSLNFTVTLGAADRTLSAADEEKYLGLVRKHAESVGVQLRG